MQSQCELCSAEGGAAIYRDDALRVVAVDDLDYPGFVRVIWNAHVAEFSELDPASRARLLAAIAAVERALRSVLRPDKINLASLGNMVPHQHWHLIPRFRDDAHFPQSIWGMRQREPDAAALRARRLQAQALPDAIRGELARG